MERSEIRPCIAMLSAYDWHAQSNAIGMPCGICNGYVLVPPEHPLYELHYDYAYEALHKNGFDGCHRGLTYGSQYTHRPDDRFLSNELPKDIDKWYCYGFDTCHYGDNAKIWDEDAVAKETESLRKQFDEFAKTANFDRDDYLFEFCKI